MLAATQEPNDEDIVLIKEETPKEEVNDHTVAAELLLHDDGETPRW